MKSLLQCILFISHRFETLVIYRHRLFCYLAKCEQFRWLHHWSCSSTLTFIAWCKNILEFLKWYYSDHVFFLMSVMSPLGSMGWVQCCWPPKHLAACLKLAMNLISIAASPVSRNSVKFKGISSCSGEFTISSMMMKIVDVDGSRALYCDCSEKILSYSLESI